MKLFYYVHSELQSIEMMEAKTLQEAYDSFQDSNYWLKIEEVKEATSVITIQLKNFRIILGPLGIVN